MIWGIANDFFYWKVQSAFMIDLNQVSLALRHATARSLILLDEFGKGTISSGSLFHRIEIAWLTRATCSDGAGLFYGILKHLLSRGATCPKVLAATHFHELFRDDIMDIGELPITFVHMQVVFTSSTGEVINVNELDQRDDISNERAEDEMKVIPGERITYLYR